MNNNNHKLEEIKEALIDYYVDCGITNYKELFLDHMSADEIIREYNNLTQYAVFCGVLTEYTGNEYHVVIPRSATSIGNEVFANNKTIISVTIPDSVEIIACGAFSGCSELQSVTIPASIKQITDYDFQGCENLNTIYGEKGSYAEEYAEEKGLIFIPIEKKQELTQIVWRTALMNIHTIQQMLFRKSTQQNLISKMEYYIHIRGLVVMLSFPLVQL